MTSYTRNRWTREECDTLVQFYPTMHADDLALKLPRHTMKAIYCKARYFGLSRTKEYIRHTRREGVKNFQKKQKEDKAFFVETLKRAYWFVENDSKQSALSILELGLDRLDGKAVHLPE
jgi:hypothetical protein